MTDSGPRQLPPLPPISNIAVLHDERSPKSTRAGPIVDSVEFFIDKLQYSYPGIASTPTRKLTDSIEQRQFNRILQHFQENIASFQEKEKYVQVDVLYGLEQRLAQFSKELHGALDDTPNHDIQWSRRFIEWPVCGKYPNCYICSIEACGIVSLVLPSL